MEEPITPQDLGIVMALAQSGPAELARNSSIARLLITDALTGLYNRSYFDMRLKGELTTATTASPLALIVVDLNRLKQLNDRYGHQTGDQAIMHVGSALRRVCPDGGAACRLAGDEFVMLLPDTSEETAQWVQVELQQEIARRPLPLPGRAEPFRLSASAGLAMAPRDGARAADLFERADAAMYTAKQETHGGALAVRRTPSTPPPLVGRQDLIDRIDERLRQTTDGAGGLLFLTGPIGIGKSRLGVEAVSLARQRNCGVVQSTGVRDPLSMLRSGTACLLQVVGRKASKRITRRYPVLLAITGDHPTETESNGGEQVNPAALTTGLHLLLVEAARQQPIVWLIDDLRLAGATGLSVLHELATHLHEVPVLIVVTDRAQHHDGDGEAVETWWQSVDGQPGCERIAVGALDAPAATALASWACGQITPQAEIERLVDAAAGNPLLLMQLSARAEGAHPDQPIDLDGIYRSAFDELSEPLQGVLGAAAIVGSGSTAELVGRLSSRSPEEGRRGLEQLCALGWLQTEGPALGFTHPAAQEAVLRALSAGWRRSLHHLAGHLLQAQGNATALNLARHFEQGGDWGRAADWYYVAAQHAEAACAPHDAAAAYRRCLELSDAVACRPDRAAIALKAAHLFQNAVDLASALPLLHYALQRCDTDQDRALAFFHLAQLHGMQGEYAVAAEMSESAVTLLRQEGHSAQLAEALSMQIQAEAYRGNRALAVALAEEVLTVSGHLEDTFQQVRWLGRVGFALCWLGERNLTEVCFARGEALLSHAPLDGDRQTAIALVNHGILARWLGRLERSARVLRTGTRLAKRHGDNRLYVTGALAQVTCLITMGYLVKAQSLLDELQPLMQRDDAKARQFQWVAENVRLSVFLGDQTRADRYVPLLRLLAREGSEDECREGHALITLVQLAQARSVDPSSWSPSVLLPVVQGDNLTTTTLLVAAEVQLAHGDVAAAQQLVTAARTCLIEPSEGSWVNWVQGMVELHGGNEGEAAMAFRRAVQLGGIAHYRAKARRALSQLHQQKRKTHKMVINSLL